MTNHSTQAETVLFVCSFMSSSRNTNDFPVFYLEKIYNIFRRSKILRSVLHREFVRPIIKTLLLTNFRMISFFKLFQRQLITGYDKKRTVETYFNKYEYYLLYYDPEEN